MKSASALSDNKRVEQPTKAGLRPVGKATLSLMALTISFAAAATAAQAVAKRSAHHGGGGGIYLNTPNPTNPLEHNNRGVELGSRGLWPQALQEGQMALDGDPFNETFQRNLSSAHLRYGDILANSKKYAEAVKQYREALFVDPANVPAEANLSTCLSHLSGKDPRDLSYRLSLASGAEAHGEYKIAVVEYRVCSHIQDSGINNYKLGRSLLHANKTVEGYDALRTALRKDWPKDDQDALVECHLLLGDTLLNFAYKAKQQNRMPDYVKRLNNAMVEYRRAVTINPSNMAAVHGLTEATREAVAIQPSFGNLLALGSAYLLQSDFDHAKVYFEKAWRANPTSPELAKARLAFHRAVVETPAGIVAPMRIAESVQKVEDLVKANPNDPDLLYIIGRGRARIGDTAGAVDALQRSLKARPFDPITTRALQQIQGGGEIAPGIAGAPGTAATAGAPGSSATSGGAVVGSNPAAAGTAPGATSSPGAAAGGAPAAPVNTAAYTKIGSLTSGGQLDQAATAADEILNKTPADGQAWYLKGLVMEKKGDLDEAAVCFRQASGLKVKEAEDALNRINNLRTKPLIDQATNLEIKGDLPGAIEIMKEAGLMSPRDSALHRKLADMLKKSGDTAGAERENKKADDAAKGK
ncbi:MAG: tetratricopeptide repeat protein [Cyanobacteria bacterium REEB67]|nr:tetratricopeptide repeat protein [Cyanobacteria bacterium REEB67]